ncbi:uncharacterized protein LOC123013631 isoform X2 [Tribolium madens]|uniref:uncharacterized protein LOC123013631 isoform X2 n=1 Tax=Tribolium madens TaxID=41895 RepID=UPI001CF7227C|nr:uncharacterized protein LOC123013631 isoform X2 [Tribolium madens]
MDGKDSSSYVPWDSFNEMSGEFDTMASIHERNNQKFQNLQDEIVRWDFCKIQNPYENRHFDEAKQDFLQGQDKALKLSEVQDGEHTLLLSRKRQLQHDIKKMEKNIKSVTAELDEGMQSLESLKKTYKEHKFALNVAKKVYEKSFHILAITEEENNDTFKAVVSFNENENFRATLSIHREHNKILSVECNCLPQKEVEDLMGLYNKTNNAMLFLCRLKKLALSESH